MTQTQSGKNIRWHYGQKFFLSGNSNNNSGLTSETIWNAVVNGLQQWKRATQGMFDFDYWQGTNAETYTPKQQKDGINSIFFASQSDQKTDPNIIGYTQVWFNSDSGDIIEADIILNDRDYVLTDSPTDTSSHTSNGGKKVYLNNVITHEIGHALGLSHSNSINSSMLYVEFSEQFKLGCDDWSAVKDLYPTFNNGMGSLTGTIISPSGEVVAGAVVTAISLIRGIPMASVLTDQNGKFNFGALESGGFSLVVEPFQGTTTSIPRTMRTKPSITVCNQNSFPKNFLTEQDQHTLKIFQVAVGKESKLGEIKLNCNELTEISDLSEKKFTQSIVDHGNAGSSKSYTFIANGPFKITALGYLLLSPIKVSLSIDSNIGGPLYRSKSSDYKIEDTSITGTAFGPITIKADFSNNESSSFPSPAVWPSAAPDFILVYNGNPDGEPSSTIPNNARCDSNEPFPAYQSPSGNPIRDSTSTSSRDGIGFCGNAQAASFHEGKRSAHKPTPLLGAILGWGFPFIVAIVCQLFLRKRRAKLNS